MDQMLKFKDHQPVQNIIQLAETIKNAGLIQPISVRPKEKTGLTDLPATVSHIITTGERRWWAHVYLAATKQTILGQLPTNIAVTFTPENANVVLQQLLENFQREDLNAAERAFGLIQLKDELEKSNQGKVKWEQVYEALGINKRYGIYLRKVNDLSPQAIEFIKKNNFKEGSVRPISTRLKDYQDHQMAALNHLLNLQATDPGDLPSLDLFIDNLLAGSGAKKNKPTQKPRISKPISPKALNKGIGKIRTDLSAIDLLSISKKDRETIVESLEELIREATEKLNSLNE
ncbi:MAG: ParB N-terminal domain-containing protein [Chloroflexota bacterium]